LVVEERTAPVELVTVVVTAPLPVVATVVVSPVEAEVVVTVLTTLAEDAAPDEAVDFDEEEPGAADSTAAMAAFNDDGAVLADPAVGMMLIVKFSSFDLEKKQVHTLGLSRVLIAK
jgi:hypothetical protein